MINFTRYSDIRSKADLQGKPIAESWTSDGIIYWYVIDRHETYHIGFGKPGDDISHMIFEKVLELYPEEDINLLFPDSSLRLSP